MLTHCALCGWVIWFWQRRANAQAFAETHPVHQRCLDQAPTLGDWLGDA